MKLCQASVFTLILFLRGPFAFAQISESDDSTVIKFQATTVTQEHGKTSTPSYLQSGSNSLSGSEEVRTSLTATLFSGARINENIEVYFDPEISAGSGLSDTHGIGGYPNGEIYRVDTPSPKFNLSRLYFKKVFGLI